MGWPAVSGQECYTLEDVERHFAPTLAYGTYRQYRDFVSPHEVLRVVLAHIADNHRAIEKWLAKSPQRTRQIERLITDAARAYCERVKAERSGYSIDDVYWYSPGVVDELKPMARNRAWKPSDETFESDGGESRRSKPAREGGDLLAMVMDVRRAAAAVGWNTSAIVDYLGGRKPKGLSE